MGRHSAVPTATFPEAPESVPDQGVTGPIPIPRQPLASSGPLPVVRPPEQPVEAVPWAAEPDQPRLLAGWLETGRPADLDEHRRRYGEPPRAEFAGRRGARRLVELVGEAGLRGRGGAGFPTARKMATVVSATTPRRRPVVVANGCEGDPTSGKDRLLLHCAPHLVLDGLALAAHAVGADQAILCVHRDSPLVESLEAAIAARPDDPADVHLVTVPRRYVASEASAVVNFLTTGDARPTSVPPLPAERGVQGRPTLVDNVETLAHLALLARNGADWFRARGTEDSPGTTLVTLDGAVVRPGVYEVDMGVSAGHLLRLAGGTTGPIQALLLGGLGGNWLPAAGNMSLAHFDYAAAGAGLGVASLLALPLDACGLTVTATILRYLAEESAGQCGPCMFGLPALAEDLEALAAGTADADIPDRLRRRLGIIPGRGACAHPDGAVRLAASTLRVFTDDIAEHLHRRPCGRPDLTAFPVLRALASPAGGWR
ncbi:NADH-ubiquinone oxidoreductase-F iron-sulfur binding region domain-containing protein [Pseudonocardia acaciae]|uniref:NADH-ubiquinone oxidoreductase-F iron-sulfur binding region domain-containing protein n=1 Tax=Pseudonocardia acaciae TaxID=551276 RepID=UPI000A06AF69|nr:NADH-ubiquinone oxidoreductase-F iron-sulfur binding region domain-containing protein [Pseudonocardia acaciae]